MDAWCIGKYINEQTSKEPYQHEVRPTQGSAKQKQKAHIKETKSFIKQGNPMHKWQLNQQKQDQV